MGFQDTINEIFKGLTGDNKADIQYLKKQMEQHRDDENSTEIIRALGRKVFELLPDEAKAELNQIIGNEVDTINSTVEEAKFQLSQNNPLKAEELLKSAIDSIPLEFKDDEECGYFCFEGALEIAIFAISEKYEKTIRKATYDFAQIYFMYAYSLIENHKIDEAENALKTALKWNPVSTTIMGELSEVYKMKKDYENYLYWSKRIIQYASSSKMLARGYRNIAYYYCDIEEYEKSAAIYYFSRYFEESKQVTSELFYIAEQLGKLPEAPEADYIKGLFKQEDIQYGASDFVIGAAYQIAKACLDNNDTKQAIYYLFIVYDLTHDDEIHTLIEKLKSSLDEEDSGKSDTEV